MNIDGDAASARRSPIDRLPIPQHMAACRGLTFEQEAHLLAQWLADELALLVADDEGMAGRRPSRVDEVLAAVQLLLRDDRRDKGDATGAHTFPLPGAE